MKIKKIVGMGCLFGILLFSEIGCYFDAVIPVDVQVGDVGNVVFASDIIPIFNSSCNNSGCHNSGGQKPDLSASTAYASLTNGGYINTESPENSIVYLWMRGKMGTSMPPSGPEAIYNAKILAWIKSGALNN